jgi:circadian clock protein KaiC
VAHEASLLILDGLVAAEAYATTELELKKFVHELQMLAAAADCTMFLLTSAGHGDHATDQRPEHTMVDGMVALRDTASGWRVERHIQVKKFRGSDHLTGLHALRITGDGIAVWPRTESLPLPQPGHPRDPSEPPVATGIAGLDTMLQGGVARASSTLVLGSAGSGKTGLSLHFLAGSTAQDPGLLLGFYETPDQLIARAGRFAPQIAEQVQSGVISFLWQGAAEDLMDRVASELLENVARKSIRRVVIDGLLGFSDMTVQPDRMPLFFRALTMQLRERGVTTLYTTEVPDVPGIVARTPLSRLTPIADNLIMLRHVEEAGRQRRMISLLKARDNVFDPRPRGFSIGDGGIVLNDDGSAPEA